MAKYQHQWPIKETKQLKHYSSDHQILLVGEGDFSFSLSLAMAFGDASNIVATSLDSNDLVIKKYNRAKTNLEILYSYGAQLIHGVDAVKMNLHTDLQMQKFDRIIYNFPHAGFLGNESDKRVIVMHKKLVQGFFRNASGMLHSDGEIHMTHKTTFPFSSWNIEELAAGQSSDLELLECVRFNIKDYPGYNNKRGAGKKPDKPFPLGECSTFKFILSYSKLSQESHHASSPRQPKEITSHRLIRPSYQPGIRITTAQLKKPMRLIMSPAAALLDERRKGKNSVDPLNDYII